MGYIARRRSATVAVAMALVATLAPPAQAAPNKPPTATDDSGSTNEDTTLTIGVTANDTDPNRGDKLTASGSGATAQGGTFSCSGTSCTYTPPANFSGSDSFDYTVSDGNGGSDTGTVT
ncbi:MAG: Ig-like domain-containing protein, partial [Actinomycetota bacterium]|nr:Ig-like domain-containing protein [Actinomycetota bacterium]